MIIRTKLGIPLGTAEIKKDYKIEKAIFLEPLLSNRLLDKIDFKPNLLGYFVKNNLFKSRKFLKPSDETLVNIIDELNNLFFRDNQLTKDETIKYISLGKTCETCDHLFPNEPWVRSFCGFCKTKPSSGTCGIYQKKY